MFVLLDMKERKKKE